MRAPALAVAALAVLGTSTAFAADTPKFKIFGGLAYVAPLAEDDVDIGTVRDSIKASEELGWTVGIEARFNKVIGLEFDYVNATSDIEFGGQVIDDIHIQPLSATLNFHIIPTEIVDFYFGPTASYFIWDDTDLGTGTEFKTDNDFAYGASAGLEIGFGKTFALMGGIRWLKADLEPDGAPKIGIDPLISRLGVAFRF